MEGSGGKGEGARRTRELKLVCLPHLAGPRIWIDGGVVSARSQRWERERRGEAKRRDSDSGASEGSETLLSSGLGHGGIRAVAHATAPSSA